MLIIILGEDFFVGISILPLMYDIKYISSHFKRSVANDDKNVVILMLFNDKIKYRSIHE